MQSRSKSENVSVSVLQLAFKISVLFLSKLGGRNVWGGRFLAGNQGSHQIFDPSLISEDL